ncbi:MAG TPA: glycosyltransferase family 2 protein, partial [Kiritimatiellia bacterium]|nr:glycosyltransferase family 2 protein [Kiritimatiellia bacterium]
MTKTVSFVLPFYNEEINLPVLCERLLALSARWPYATELVFVNDGSTDGSLAYLTSLIAAHGNIRVVDLSRNFGQMTAVHAGLQHAAGDAVIIMDTDLQDRPEAALDLVAEWERGADVVYAIRAKRKESFAKRILFRSFYAVFRRLAEIPIPEEAGLFSLMDRRVVDLLVALPERNRYIPGLRAWVGFRQVGVTVERDRRGDKLPRQSFI